MVQWLPSFAADRRFQKCVGGANDNQKGQWPPIHHNLKGFNEDGKITQTCIKGIIQQKYTKVRKKR